METKYSVLMSVYKKEIPEYLKLSVDSMLNQTVKPEQIVLVEDGLLTEELDDVISQYKTEYPELFTIVTLKKNQGLGKALNEGFKHCRNELVARMDTDDISYLERCEKQLVEFSKDSNLGIVGGHTSEFYYSPKEVVSQRIVPTEYESILKFSKTRSPFNHPAVMYKKSEVLAVGGYPPLKRKQDLGLFINMLACGTKAININEPVIYYRSDEENYRRRKTWNNCKTYIEVIYKSWRTGYSSIMDLMFVVVTQVGMYLAPMPILKFVSDNVLRKNTK